jgi:hypothetical protein
MTSIEIAECRLRLSRKIKTHESPRLRNFFGRAFEEEVVRQSYDVDGQPIFEYPRIQFKVIESTAVLLGIDEGAELLRRLWPAMDETELGDGQVTVLETQFETRQDEITDCPEPIEYRFLTPWLALNEKNFRSYTGSRNTAFRKDELSRIVVGNCLGLAKSLGISFREHIDADCRQLASIKTTVKGKGMVGFVGKFQVNLKLPEYLGLGKSVSRGFGTISMAAV